MKPGKSIPFAGTLKKGKGSRMVMRPSPFFVAKENVLMAGLEPARLAARDFKSPVSAISPHQRIGEL